ncbi:kinesin-like protein KIF27 [Erpetoichthys calabaricus]|uniref:kinesin-like protein KIF27 n=1 Tax=Erpetoichthys calabaricus TaxID=27687 RepID=UPI002234D32F|nr:kinesin-like protein KIF27 [Erpetoichthys calabaricus]
MAEEIPVRVAVRIRPLLPKEILHNQHVCVRVVPNSQQVIIGKDRAFTFDFVFGQKSAQDEVYASCIKPLVLSFLEGYNVTIFAYGQTGSGKTYTLGGGHVVAASDEEKGIIPRAIHEIFQSIAENHNTDFTVKVSYIEVHKEELRDLLELETSSKDMHIREDENGNTVIVGAKEFIVESADEVTHLLEGGNAARHTGTTQMNEYSSRSHAILTIIVDQQVRKIDGVLKNGWDVEKGSPTSVHLISSKFHFVDLAGSERVTKTGNTGERFKESVQINSGLLALGNVISALGDPKRKSQHVPYRDAKITRILKDSLGGNAKTLMIACISPSSFNFDESLNSLKYANRARNIKNKPIVNYNPDWDRMNEMEQEIQALREALHNQRGGMVTRGSQVSQDLTGEQEKMRMEERLAQLQVECYHYRTCTEDAFHILLEMKETVDLPKRQIRKLQEWLDAAEEFQSENFTTRVDIGSSSTNEETQRITILQLKREMKKYQDALATDEKIFSQKEAEMKQLQEQINTLLQEHKVHLAILDEEKHKQMLQNEKLVEQQLLTEQLREELQTKNRFPCKTCLSGKSDVEFRSTRRLRTVPVPTSQSEGYTTRTISQNTLRKVHTSPPTYSLERVIAAFRTRNQMLLSEIEDQDEVHCRQTCNSGDEDKNNPLLRNRTWTRKQIPMNSCYDLQNLFRNMKTNSCDRRGVSNGVETVLAEENQLHRSQSVNLQRLKDAELKLMQASQKMKDLAMKIKMKEELIKELVKTGKDAHAVNRHHFMKISQLQQEADLAKKELADTQKQLKEVENREIRDGAETTRLQKEFRKKVETAKLKVQVLKKKQQDTKRLASLSAQSEKRLAELEQSVCHMKHQQMQLQKRLREETEKKKKLENEIQKDQYRIKELQLKTEQQQKMLRLKSEELASFKKLKGGIKSFDEHQKLKQKRKWLDEEAGKILQERQALAKLEEELKKREEIVAQREAFAQETCELEIKKMRSSQDFSKHIDKLSTQLSLLEKNRQLESDSEANKNKMNTELELLYEERSLLLKRRDSLDDKLQNDCALTSDEEHVVFQLEEGLEVMDAAIQYKEKIIQNWGNSPLSSADFIMHNEAGALIKLSTLSSLELKALLFKYFNKVVCLREAERKLQLKSDRMEIQVKEKESVIRQLESSLVRLSVEIKRKLTLQQKEHEQRMQLLLREVKEQGGENISESIQGYESKIQMLEKDVFFYKKTSRQLKKKLKEHVEKSLSRPSSSSENTVSLNKNKNLQRDEKSTTTSEIGKTMKRNTKCKVNPSLNSPSRQQSSNLCKEVVELSPAFLPIVHSKKRATVNRKRTFEDKDPKIRHTTTHSRVTHVRVLRKKLKEISAPQLCMRNCSFGPHLEEECTLAPHSSTEIQQVHALH